MLNPGGGEDRSEAWDRETFFSQLAKRSSQNVDSGVRNNTYFRSTSGDRHRDHFLWNSFQNLCVFCRGRVSGERLISYGTYCQFHTREYSMVATLMKTVLFPHCLVCCSGEWISCVPWPRVAIESKKTKKKSIFKVKSQNQKSNVNLRNKKSIRKLKTRNQIGNSKLCMDHRNKIKVPDPVVKDLTSKK